MISHHNLNRSTIKDLSKNTQQNHLLIIHLLHLKPRLSLIQTLACYRLCQSFFICPIHIHGKNDTSNHAHSSKHRKLPPLTSLHTHLTNVCDPRIRPSSRRHQQQHYIRPTLCTLSSYPRQTRWGKGNYLWQDFSRLSSVSTCFNGG